MDNEMIDRVAKAIALRDTTDEFAMARAAIAAMREPTEKMLNAEGVHSSCHTCGGHKEGWQAMIDAVINE